MNATALVQRAICGGAGARLGDHQKREALKSASTLAAPIFGCWRLLDGGQTWTAPQEVFASSIPTMLKGKTAHLFLGVYRVAGRLKVRGKGVGVADGFQQAAELNRACCGGVF
jgi:hypothetical protein